MLIVKVKHIKYNNTLTESEYYFKTKEEVKNRDVVVCDTKNGIALGLVIGVYSTIEELLNLRDLPYLYSLKDCKVFRYEEMQVL